MTIKRHDTDVMVLSLAKAYDFHGCLLFSGSNNIKITELGIKLGQEKYQPILGLHIILQDVTA